ncbi:hypothetical protein [Streptomyces mirabilis]|uniref:hypothetical protein n=1 Tax=Streptomyces mirabilis TaxID=68239 RepID=UPI0036DA9244
MPVSLTKELRTPAEVAGAVLDAIAADPESFRMETWVDLSGASSLAPNGDVCGTTMCAAGWAAHVTGWTLHVAWEPQEVTDRYGEDVGIASEWAEKDGVRRKIDDVAEEVLGLGDDETFWLMSEQNAIERLREIAGRA